MLALTQCWFTRQHQPETRSHRGEDGAHHAWCRHCEREIISWDKGRWFLADGFNVTRLAETVGGRFIFLLDTADEMVVARYGVTHITDPAELETFKAQMRTRHGADEPGSTIELFDSGAPAAKAPARRAKPRRLPPSARYAAI